MTSGYRMTSVLASPVAAGWAGMDDFARRVDRGGGRSTFPILAVDVARFITLRRVPADRRAEAAGRLDGTLHFLYPSIDRPAALVVSRADRAPRLDGGSEDLRPLFVITVWRMENAESALFRQLVDLHGSRAFLPSAELGRVLRGP